MSVSVLRGRWGERHRKAERAPNRVFARTRRPIFKLTRISLETVIKGYDVPRGNVRAEEYTSLCGTLGTSEWALTL